MHLNRHVFVALLIVTFIIGLGFFLGGWTAAGFIVSLLALFLEVIWRFGHKQPPAPPFTPSPEHRTPPLRGGTFKSKQQP